MAGEGRTEFWTVLYDTEPDALCVLSKAADLAAEQDLVCCSWLINSKEALGDDIKRLASAGAQRVTHLYVPELNCNSERTVRDFLADAAKKDKPAVILFLSSVFSHAVAPGLAVLLETGITADCTNLYWDTEKRFIQSRPAFGGRTQADIRSKMLPVIATVRRGVFPLTHYLTEEPVRYESVQLGKAAEFCEILNLTVSASPLNLSRAEIIVAGGAGMGDKDRFNRLYILAEHIGGKVAASRKAVAEGLARYEQQVGQTGITVRPKWYLAFGISGAVQHLSGMIDSQNIIAVNPDRKAPIHKVSNYSIYADAGEVVEQLIRKLV